MTKHVITGAFALLCATPAFSADLPSRAAPPVYVPPPVPVFTWTGFYAGVQGGYAFGRDNTYATGTTRRRIGVVGGGGGGGDDGGGEGGEFAAAAVALPPNSARVATRTTSESLSSSPSGVVGGGHVGYNFSTASLFSGGILGPAGIIGIEGDAEGLDNSRTTYVGTAFSKVKSDLQGSIRGRLGFGFDRFLVYGTGGAAFGDFKTAYGANAAAFQSFDNTRVGWTAGGGVEYAFTNNWSARVEYRYSDFGTFSSALTTIGSTADITVRHRETNQRVEGGISYLFTTPVAPVVARY